LTHRFELGGTRGYLTIGLYPDGGIGEVFCTISKDGSTLSGFADAFSTLLSFALQYGIPLEDVAERFMGTKFEPHGFTDNKNIPTASSIIDYLFRWLLEQSENAVQTVPERAKVESIANGTAKWKHTGDVCATCGALLIATGRCKTCTGCGLTTGCGG
jgi:ribonucleoside-diphosphate reductase alpha chain